MDPDLLDVQIDSQELVVLNAGIVGRPVKELDASQEYGCFITRLRRTQIDLPVTDETVLQRGDTLTVVGNTESMEDLAARVGVIERNVIETDLVTFAGGIALGLLIGQIEIKIGSVAIGIGTAGGLLLAGILVG